MTATDRALAAIPTLGHLRAVDPDLPWGRRLQYHRARAGLSVNELARAVAVDPSYISRLERGQRAVPRRPVVVRLAAALALGPAATDGLLLGAGYVLDYLRDVDPALLRRVIPYLVPLAGLLDRLDVRE